MPNETKAPHKVVPTTLPDTYHLQYLIKTPHRQKEKWNQFRTPTVWKYTEKQNALYENIGSVPSYTAHSTWSEGLLVCEPI